MLNVAILSIKTNIAETLNKENLFNVSAEVREVNLVQIKIKEVELRFKDQKIKFAIFYITLRQNGLYFS